MKTGVRVGDAMTHEPVTIPPNLPLVDVARIMRKEDVGSLIVTNKDILVGIITEWDIVRKVVALNKDISKLRARDVMTKKLITISPNADLYEAMLRMRNNDIRHLPVVEKERLVGFLTMKDVLKLQPDLFDIVVQRWEIREAKEKLERF